jgi:hypothetical protein
MAAPPDNSSRWWDKWRRRPSSTDPNPDVLVAEWKTAWLEGAQAAWAPQRLYNNPYTSGAQRSAWDAGWRWAGRNPDRRSKQVPLIAHPHRRQADTTLTPLKRAAALGATGVTIYAISRVLQRWRRTP